MKESGIRVAITGLSGVVGQVIIRSLPSSFQIIDLFHHSPVTVVNRQVSHVHLDLQDSMQVMQVLEQVHPDFIIHLAAVTHIDVCERDKHFGQQGIVWKINVEGAGAIAKYCSKHNIHLTYLSTECVFDGTRKKYNEIAEKNPINWYGLTKSAAEDRIIDSGCPSAIVRAVVAYHPKDNGKTIYGKLYNPLKYNKEVSAVGNQYFTPTYTYDIGRAIGRIIQKKYTGIYHVAPSGRITPYDFAKLIAKKYGFDDAKIHKVTLRKLYGPALAALRLKNACLSGVVTNRTLGIRPKPPKDVIKKRANSY